MENYIFKKKIDKYFINFLRHNCNSEVGGYRIYDGHGNHMLQNPEELSWLIKNLYLIQKKYQISLKNFLEFGYASGFTNTILNKFFNFKKIITVDIISQEGQSKDSFFSNLRFKNLVLICGNSTCDFVKQQVEVNASYDLAFIDGGHNYDVVKNDYNLALKYMSKKSVIVFHDIDSSECNGPRKLWKELSKNKKYEFREYVCRKYKIKYGIGIIIIK